MHWSIFRFFTETFCGELRGSASGCLLVGQRQSLCGELAFDISSRLYHSDSSAAAICWTVASFVGSFAKKIQNETVERDLIQKWSWIMRKGMAVISAGVLVRVLACTVQAADSRWHEYQSDNFTLHSDISSRAAQTMLADFET